MAKSAFWRVVSRSNERNRVHYTFVIKDTGCGMSAKFLEKIYKPFERDSRFGVPRVTGTGLGMTIVKSLGRAYGWQHSYQQPC
mgnify:CR=1 FL=1